MDNQTLSKLQKPKFSLWKIIALALGLGISFFLLVFFWNIGIGYILSILWDSNNFVEIHADEIPMYPNAQNIIREKPAENTLEIATWEFTTNDAPETVWKFYVDEMGRRWGFFKSGADTLYSRELVRAGCPAYLLDMTSTSTDTKTYHITILFSYDPCR